MPMDESFALFNAFIIRVSEGTIRKDINTSTFIITYKSVKNSKENFQAQCELLINTIRVNGFLSHFPHSEGLDKLFQWEETSPHCTLTYKADDTTGLLISRMNPYLSDDAVVGKYDLRTGEVKPLFVNDRSERMEIKEVFT